MKNNQILFPLLAIGIGIILLFARKKSETYIQFIGYTAIFGGLSYFVYSSKAILLSMYQKFIQDEVNIQLQQPKKQNYKQQSKKKINNKLEGTQKQTHFLKSQLQKQAEQLQQQESESGSQSEDDKQIEEQKLEAAKLQAELEKQKKLEQEKEKAQQLQKERQEKLKNDQKQNQKNSTKVDQKQETNQQNQTQLNLSTSKQNLKSEPNQEKKSKKVKPDQLLRFQSQPEENENDEEWLEVGNKKKNNQPQKEKKTSKSDQQNILNETQTAPQVQNSSQQLNQQQKQQNSQKLQPEQLQNSQKNQQTSEIQSGASIKNLKQEPLQKPSQKQQTQSLIVQAANQQQQQVTNSKSQEEIKKANKLQKKKEKKLEAEKFEQDDEDWIPVQPRIKPISAMEEQVDEVAQQEQKEKKKKGLFTQEEYQKLQEEAKQIEQTYKLRIQQIEEINRIKYIQKTTQYQVKGAEDILKNSYIVAPPKIEYSLPEIKPKLMTREEIDQLVEAKLPKKKIVQSNDIFIQRSDVAPKSVKEVEGKKQFKSKIMLLKQNESEVKENLFYTDTPAAFQNNSDKLKPFFSSQLQLQFNIAGKELFGRVKRYRRPIQEKKQNEDTKIKDNQMKEGLEISETIQNSKRNEISDKKKVQKLKVQFDEEPKYLIKPENQITTSAKEELNKPLKSSINNTPQLQENQKKVVQKVKQIEEKAKQAYVEDNKNQKNQTNALSQDLKAVKESNKSEEKDTQGHTNNFQQINKLKAEKNKQEQEKQLTPSSKNDLYQIEEDIYVPKEQVGLKQTKLSKQKNEKNEKNQGNDIYVPKQQFNKDQENKQQQIQRDDQDQKEIYIVKSQAQENNLQVQQQLGQNQIENKKSDDVVQSEKQEVDEQPEQIEIQQIDQQQMQSYDEDYGEIVLESCCPDEGFQEQNELQEKNNAILEPEPLESKEKQQYQKIVQTVQEGSEQPNVVQEQEVAVNNEISKPLESHQEQQHYNIGQTVQVGQEQPNLVYEEEEVVNVQISKPLESHEEQQHQNIVQLGQEQPNIVYEEEEVVNVQISKPLESHEEQQHQNIVQLGQEQPNIVYEEEEVVNVQISKPLETINEKEVQENFQNQSQHLEQLKNDNNQQDFLQADLQNVAIVSPNQKTEEQNNTSSNQFLIKQDEPSPVGLPPINKSTNILQQIENSQEIFDNSAFLNDIEQKPKILPGVLDLTFNSKTKLINNQIKVNYRKDAGQEQILELETMNLILEGCKEIIADEYINYLENARKSRRQALQDKQYSEYLSLVLQMGDEQFKITQDGFNFLANSLNIQEEVFQNSFVFYSQHDEYSDEFVEQLTFVQQNMKDIPPTKHTIRKRQGIELIEFQISVIENYTQNEYFKEVLRIFQEQETPKEVLPILLNSVIDDIIFEKYGYEEEDKIRFLKQYHNDKEIRALTEKMETMVEILFDVKME